MKDVIPLRAHLHLMTLGFTEQELDDLREIVARVGDRGRPWSPDPPWHRPARVVVRQTARRTQRRGARMFGEKPWKARMGRAFQKHATLYDGTKSDPWSPLFHIKQLDLDLDPY